MAVVKDRRVSRTKYKNNRVVLSRQRYDELIQDLHDLAVVAERKEDPTISMQEMTKRLRKRGLLSDADYGYRY